MMADLCRSLVRLTVLGGVAAYATDRILAARRGDGPPTPIRRWSSSTHRSSESGRSSPTSKASPAGCGDEGRSRPTPGPIGVGTRGEADVRILGIGVTDPVEIVEFDPPRRFAIRHDGVFKGGGVIELTGRARTVGRRS